jgi:hypothetical protein
VSPLRSLRCLSFVLVCVRCLWTGGETQTEDPATWCRLRLPCGERESGVKYLNKTLERPGILKEEL